jgi:hypothetical protein
MAAWAGQEASAPRPSPSTVTSWTRGLEAAIRPPAPGKLLDPGEGGDKNGAMARATLPEPYLTLDDATIADRIAQAKRALGKKLVILGHHYQRDDVIRHADITGDSYKLARLGSERTDAEFVVFAGVHFMA